MTRQQRAIGQTGDKPHYQDTDHLLLPSGQIVFAGDTVTVTGERGPFVFRALQTNTRGESWAHVYGGPPGRERSRDFAIERIVVPAKRSARKHSAR